MLGTVAILHKTGECLFERNYDGAALPLNALISASSSLSHLAKTASTAAAASASAAAAAAAAAGASGSGPGSAPAASAAALAAAALAADADIPLSPRLDAVSDVALSQCGNSLLAALKVGPYTLLAAASATAATPHLLASLLTSLQSLLHFFLGPFALLADDPAPLRALSHLIEAQITRFSSDFAALVGAPPSAPVDAALRGSLEQVLATVESADAVVGSGLFLGAAVVHSRLPPAALYWISALLAAAAPLAAATATGAANAADSARAGAAAAAAVAPRVRVVPAFTGGRWVNIIMVQVKTMVLVLLASIRAPFPSLLPFLADLEEVLLEAHLPLPDEAPPQQLRQFAGPDTLAFVVVSRETGLALAPTPRLTANSGLPQLVSSFAWFYARAAAVLSGTTIGSVTLATKGYRFLAELRATHAVYYLTTDALSSAGIEAAAQESLALAVAHNAIDPIPTD